MEFITIILNFFTDSTKRITARATIFIALIITLWFIDNTFSFTYYYNIDKKITYLEKINKVINDSSTSKSDLAYLLQQKNEIVIHKNLKDNAWDFIYNSKLKDVFIKNNSKNENITIDERNPTIHFITSSLLLLLVMIVIPFVAYADKSLTFVKATLMVFIIEVIFYSISIVISNALALIPIIIHRPYLNYLLNIFFNLLLYLLIYQSIKKERNLS